MYLISLYACCPFAGSVRGKGFAPDDKNMSASDIAKVDVKRNAYIKYVLDLVFVLVIVFFHVFLE
jgi:hypothetical protein